MELVISVWTTLQFIRSDPERGALNEGRAPYFRLMMIHLL